MREQCVPGPLLSFVGPGNEATGTSAYIDRFTFNSMLIEYSMSDGMILT